jgi:hypothetical protein
MFEAIAAQVVAAVFAAIFAPIVAAVAAPVVAAVFFAMVVRPFTTYVWLGPPEYDCNVTAISPQYRAEFPANAYGKPACGLPAPTPGRLFFQNADEDDGDADKYPKQPSERQFVGQSDEPERRRGEQHDRPDDGQPGIDEKRLVDLIQTKHKERRGNFDAAGDDTHRRHAHHDFVKQTVHLLCNRLSARLQSMRARPVLGHDHRHPQMHMINPNLIYHSIQRGD